ARLGARPRGLAVLGSAHGAAVGPGPVLLAECRRSPWHEPTGRRRRDPRGRAVHPWWIDPHALGRSRQERRLLLALAACRWRGLQHLRASAQHRSLAAAG